jgi:hypothetical protein
VIGKAFLGSIGQMLTVITSLAKPFAGLNRPPVGLLGKAAPGVGAMVLVAVCRLLSLSKGPVKKMHQYITHIDDNTFGKIPSSVGGFDHLYRMSDIDKAICSMGLSNLQARCGLDR